MKGRYWTVAQRQELEGRLAAAENIALFRRLLALLEIDRGRGVTEIAEELHVDRRSVYRWIERYASEGKPEALEHQPGQGRPLKWNKDLHDLLESALTEPPVEIGYPANTWTVPLLQAFLGFHLPEQEISPRTVRRRLKELGYVETLPIRASSRSGGREKNARFWGKSGLWPSEPLF